METLKDLLIIAFKSQKDLHDWLEGNHQKSQGLWLKLAKKSSGMTSIS